MSAAARILVVEDDEDTRDLLVFVLEELGYDVDTAGTGAEALDRARRGDPDLVTLDMTLPDADGADICRELRGFTDAYIMMITGRTDEADRIAGLQIGGDDYLVKPFSPQEVSARVGALLRRPRASKAVGPAVVEVGGGLVLRTSAHTALLHGVLLPLTHTEVELLAVFASEPGRTWTRAELVKVVWQGDFIESDYLVDVQIASVRRKLRQAGSTHQWIRTVDGTSYVFAGAADEG